MKFHTDFAPFWAPEDEGGSGGGEGETKDTGGDAGADAEETGIANADDQGAAESKDDEAGTVLDGGTAEGEANSGDGDGEGDEGAGDGEDDGDSEVPEEYEFNNLPEGVELDQDMADAVTPVFKDLGLTQDQADKLVEAYVGAQTKAAEAQADMIGQTMKEWVETAKTDKEIGHNNWDSSVQAANAVLREFGTPELVQDVMVGQGVGNHPEVIRLLARIGKAVSDDQFLTGEQTDTSADVPAETRWYGDTTPTSKKG